MEQFDWPQLHLPDVARIFALLTPQWRVPRDSFEPASAFDRQPDVL
eukprot:SAG31_NODE_37691_length_302_cov_0.763547_2_plen_45_part_01